MLVPGVSIPGLVRSPHLLRFHTRPAALRCFSAPASAGLAQPSTEAMQVDNPLIPQAFASSTLDRSAGNKREPSFVSDALRKCLLLFVNGKAICVRNFEGRATLYWATESDLEKFGLAMPAGTEQIHIAGNHTTGLLPDHIRLPLLV